MRSAYWEKVRELCAESGMKYSTVKQRLDKGLPLELALMKNPFDFIHKQKELLKNKPMRYWIVRNHTIIQEER